MQLNPATKRKLTSFAIALLGPSLASGVYPFLFVVPFGHMWHAHVNGLMIGILIGLAVSFGQLYLFKTRIRRLRFSLFIICQT